MKMLHKLETFVNFWDFDKTWVVPKLILSKTGPYPIKQKIGERIQLLLNNFGVLIYENFGNFVKIVSENRKFLEILKSIKFF